MSISLHVIIDGLDNAALDRCYNWLVKNRVDVANLKGAEQFDRLRSFAERLRSGLPQCKIIVRQWPDDGAFGRYGWNGNDWYDAVAVPLRDWLRQHNLILLADNESVTDDMRPYAAASVQAMRRATADGIGLAVGRTATGNPAEHQYAQMDDLWREFPNASKCVYSPNEYHAQTPELSGGNIARYLKAWEYCSKTLKIPTPFTTIGEYGYLHSDGNLPKPRLDPEWGWRRDGLSGKQAAQMDARYDKEWYAPYGVEPCAFAFCVLEGQWKDTSVDDADWLDTITEHNASLYREPPPVVIEPPAPTPANKPAVTDDRWKSYIAKVPGNVQTRVRREPWVTAPILTAIGIGVNYELKHIPYHKLTEAEIEYQDKDPKGFWHLVLIGNYVGYIRSDVVTLTPNEIVLPPKPPEQAPGPPTTPVDYVTKAECQRLIAEALAAFRAELAAAVAGETQVQVKRAG